MSDTIPVTHEQVLEAMRELVGHRIAVSNQSAFSPEETKLRVEAIRRIDDAYMDLLGKFKSYKVERRSTECGGDAHG